jgi:hypothetical protein
VLLSPADGVRPGARSTQFTLSDQPFYFAGTTTSYLPHKSNLMVNAVLDAAQGLGLKVIRRGDF